MKSFSSENHKVELEIRITEKNSTWEELGKSKSGSEEDEVKKEEDNSSTVKERRVVATELLPPKLPKTRSLRERLVLYSLDTLF